MRAILFFFSFTLLFAQTPDTIYYHGKIITMWDAQPIAEAVAIRGNRFLAVGSSHDILRTAGTTTKKIDLLGKTVVPGLIESHTHPIAAAMSERDSPVPTIHSIQDIQAYIRAQAAKLPTDRIIFVPKVYASRLKERRYPTRYELDSAAPNRPAMCDNGYASVLNSYLLKQAGISKDTPQPSNGKIIKDKNGEPTGAILGAPDLLSRFRANRPTTHEDMLWAIKSMQKAYNRVGITSTCDRL